VCQAGRDFCQTEFWEEWRDRRKGARQKRAGRRQTRSKSEGEGDVDEERGKRGKQQNILIFF
jgi:hypothetical protein